MDACKAVAARITRPHKSVNELQGLLKVVKKTPPIFAVPTTAGTGSETTIAAVITEAKTHHKASINDPVSYTHLDVYKRQGLYPFPRTAAISHRHQNCVRRFRQLL